MALTSLTSSLASFKIEIKVYCLYYRDQSRSQAGQGSQGNQAGDGEVPSSDKTLSDILDAVIENMPDSERGSNDVSVLLDLETCQLKQDFSVRHIYTL